MKKAFLVLFSLFSLFSFSQTINDYEYVIIPTKFNFQNSPSEYQLNAFLKCQLEEYGFKTYYDTDLVHLNPEDRCLFLTANVNSVSNIFSFRLLIEFQDCYNAVVLQSDIGGSKEKDRYDAFNEALDGAMKSPKVAKYKFTGISKDIRFMNLDEEQIADGIQPKVKEIAIVESTNNTLKPNGANAVQVPVLPVKTIQNAVVQSTPKKAKSAVSKSKTGKKRKLNSAVAKSNGVKKKPIVVAQTKVNASKINEVKAEVVQKEAIVETVKEVAEIENNATIKIEEAPKQIVLYAQAIENGFQLIDTTPKVIMKIFNTLQANYYTANVDKKYGAVFMKNNDWVFEYFTEGNLVTEKMTIKFCDQ